MNRTYLFDFLLVLAIALLLGSCGRSGNSKSEQAANAAGEDTKVVPVEVYRVRTGEIAEEITAVGTIQSFRETYVAAEATGRITHLHVEVGDRVRSGYLLAQLDDELPRLAVDQARAQQLQAKATFEKAARDLERHEKLFVDGSVTEFELETARVNKDVSEASFLLAESGLQIARRQLADTRITSPIDGVVAERSVDVGETVAPGTPVAKIVDIGRLKVKIGLPEEQIVKVHPGQEVTLSVDAYPGSRFDGTVFSVGPEASPETRTFPVDIVIQNTKDHPLKSGMMARVDIAVDVLQNIPILPRDAILERAGEYIAFVVDDGTARRRILDLGAQSGDMVEIRRGVMASEDVVVIGQENLSDGTSVSVQNRRNQY